MQTCNHPCTISHILVSLHTITLVREHVQHQRRSRHQRKNLRKEKVCVSILRTGAYSHSLSHRRVMLGSLAGVRRGLVNRMNLLARTCLIDRIGFTPQIKSPQQRENAKSGEASNLSSKCAIHKFYFVELKIQSPSKRSHRQKIL